jgi:hypothetical protein
LCYPTLPIAAEKIARGHPRGFSRDAAGTRTSETPRFDTPESTEKFFEDTKKETGRFNIESKKAQEEWERKEEGER